MIQMRYLNKVYEHGIHALDNINIEIARGEFVFLVGPSGAGKSTLLRIIYADERPSSGLVFVGGVDISKIAKKNIPYLRRRIGVVFQDFKLLYQKTVFENVAFVLQVIGTKKGEIYKKTIKALNLMELIQKKSSFPHEISGGEQQRVAIARAIVNDPPILLADEPTGNLDNQLSKGIMDIFLEANMQGTTVIVATHDINLAKKMGKRIICLSHGQVVE